MKDVTSTFNERVEEIEQYLELVGAVERGVQMGAPLIGTKDKRITVTQQRILYSSSYLHLYNLVEATISLCIAAIEKAASLSGRLSASNLSEKMRREWTRTLARTHVQLNPEKRLDSAVELCDHIVGMLPVNLSIDKEGGGNWDDEKIFEFTKRLGVDLNISDAGNRAAKKLIRDNMGALKLIKSLRNKLAHGEISFGECGDGLTESELTNLKDDTVCYLREIIDSFSDYIDQEKYLSKAVVGE
ncbi:MAG: hypothetical protein ACI9Y1_002690 [Lentisphaeria bacterium]|jgi:hypothetical protein